MTEIKRFPRNMLEAYCSNVLLWVEDWGALFNLIYIYIYHFLTLYIYICIYVYIYICIYIHVLHAIHAQGLSLLGIEDVA